MLHAAWLAEEGYGLVPHNHYCPYRRHVYECPGGDVPSYGCQVRREANCPDCVKQALAVSTMIIPVVCERCGAWKRAEDGRSLYVSIQCRRGKRMVCPDCYEAEKAMEGLEKVVAWDDTDDDDVPF